MDSQSLLPSRDEVFKEKKHFGEDFAISSLHLFQGDMDLPNLSFHASMEEQWDDEQEPEEIETVLKVVPPAYHHYLDVFFKVRKRNFLHTVPEALGQFQLLKDSFTTAPILSYFNPSLSAIVETDASDYSLVAVISRFNDSGKNPIEFDSHKLLPAELNYEIHDKKLLEVVWALKPWRDFLLSLSHYFEVLTDHFSLQYFMSSKVITCHQAHWDELFSEFQLTINY
ncbi:hypothetical protein O181_001142 [Austropuccinia psidii MF-1]|uniref:Reverse transcriptase RNase H-like domain-containing protein n=1 Tax=Austropuccinia psidii MF-1 TaxID=1389203 RepID=A0A9Q3GCR1_9BASI|nr:hypothetical protein [Austropuccinia psidii MF-1]